MGNKTSIVTKVLIQSIIILIVGLLMGAKLSNYPLGWLGGLLLIVGYGIGFSGFALAVASSTDSSEGYHMMIFLLQLPLLFLSNSLYPSLGNLTYIDADWGICKPNNLCCDRPSADYIRPNARYGYWSKYSLVALLC